jgi:hypothetical protein
MGDLDITPTTHHFSLNIAANPVHAHPKSLTAVIAGPGGTRYLAKNGG